MTTTLPTAETRRVRASARAVVWLNEGRLQVIHPERSWVRWPRPSDGLAAPSRFGAVHLPRPRYFRRAGEDGFHWLDLCLFLEPATGASWVGRVRSRCGIVGSTTRGGVELADVTAAARQPICARCHPQTTDLGALLVSTRFDGSSWDPIEVDRRDEHDRPITVLAGEVTVTSITLGVEYRCRVERGADDQPAVTETAIRSLDGRPIQRIAYRRAGFVADLAVGVLAHRHDDGVGRGRALAVEAARRVQRIVGGPRPAVEWRAQQRAERLAKYRRALELEADGVPGRVAAGRMHLSYGTYRNLLAAARKARDAGEL